MKNLLLIVMILFSSAAFSQKAYQDSLNSYIKNYVQNHEVVKGEDKKFMQFYPVRKAYRVEANIEKATNSQWLTFPTSGSKTKLFKLYGTLDFQLNGKPLQLNVYQSQELMMSEEYKNYLFLPFTDSTTGSETYAGGRYIDLTTKDIQNNQVILDFNKADNPSCAYVSGIYNCPIPPKENALPVAVKAGEIIFSREYRIK